MGRLFWKFFLIVWLVQLAGAVATGAIFFLEHQRRGPPPLFQPGPPPPDHALDRPAPGDHPPFPDHKPPPPAGGEPPPPPPGLMPPPWPVVLVGLLASLLSAAAIAWTIAHPVRRLKNAFAAAGDGNLGVRIGAAMGRRDDELTDLGRDFDRMADRLQQQIEAQKHLLHDVSHELRSPLARLHAAIGLARQQPERFEESLNRVEREGERMNTLVGELLTLARLDAGETGVLEDFDLGDLLADLADDARFEAAARSIRVELENLPGLLVRANPELLHRAIENVVRNALRHSPVGGEVRIVASRQPAGRCRVVVLDSGAGVAPSQLAEIFTPFRRGSGQGEGYGLGLAIARRVLHGLNGEISAANRPQGGFCVTLELPALAD